MSLIPQMILIPDMPCPFQTAKHPDASPFESSPSLSIEYRATWNSIKSHRFEGMDPHLPLVNIRMERGYRTSILVSRQASRL